jgi:hypothetical protein
MIAHHRYNIAVYLRNHNIEKQFRAEISTEKKPYKYQRTLTVSFNFMDVTNLYFFNITHL